MSFTTEDEAAFYERRDELVEGFQTWLASTQGTEGEPSYAEVALDWKWGYRDGHLGRWTVADLEEFLLRWCPRKLSVPTEECPAVPRSVRAFMTFLDSRGLLARGSSTLGQLQDYCERNIARFVIEMADPANYGLAKGFFAQAGGLEPETKLDAAVSIRTVDPVIPPDPDERAKSAAAAPALVQLQRLREFCAVPGRPLTQKGNLRLADARHLVELLGTGDVPDVEIGEHRRSLRSAEDLPVLSWLVELAVEARALRRHRGRLVAVARWSELSPVEAVDRLVDAAVTVGLSGSPPPYFSGLALVQDLVDEGAGRLLAELLDARAAGEPLPVEELIELMVDAVSQSFVGLQGFHLSFVPRWVRTQLDRLAALGIISVRDVAQKTTEWGDVEAHGGVAELTPAGTPVAVRLAEELGIVVLARPDPATATARDLVELIGHLAPETWLADAGAWVRQRSPEQAAQDIVTALNDAELPGPVVLAVLSQLHDLVGAHAVPAIRTMLTGPHDSLALHVLLDAGALDPTEVDADLLLRSGIDLMLVAYELGGIDDLLATLDTANPEFLDLLWHADHPRVAELLELIGHHHPDKRVAKSARRALLRHRSWLAGRT